MIRSGFASGRTCNKVTVWEVIGGHLRRGLFCLLHWKEHVFSWLPPSVFPPACFLASLLWLQQFFLLCVPILLSSLYSSSPFTLLLIPFLLASLLPTKCVTFPCAWGDSKRGSASQEIIITQRTSRDVAESQRTHLLSFLCTREGVCVCVRVLVCVHVCLAEFTGFTLSGSLAINLVC